MVKINLTKITLNEQKMRQIANMAQSQAIKDLLVAKAHQILNEAKPMLPVNMKQDTPHMKDKYYVSKPMKTRFRIQGQYFPSTKINIKPKGKFKVYYAVVTSGNRLGKQLVYTNPRAQPYVLENLVRKRNDEITKDAIQCLLKEVSHVDR